MALRPCKHSSQETNGEITNLKNLSDYCGGDILSILVWRKDGNVDILDLEGRRFKNANGSTPLKPPRAPMTDNGLRATDVVLIDGDPRIISINGTRYINAPEYPHRSVPLRPMKHYKQATGLDEKMGEITYLEEINKFSGGDIHCILVWRRDGNVDILDVEGKRFMNENGSTPLDPPRVPMKDYGLPATDIQLIDGEPMIVSINGTRYLCYPSVSKV